MPLFNNPFKKKNSQQSESEKLQQKKKELRMDIRILR